MIFKKKRYKFDTVSLTFIEVQMPMGSRIKNLLLYFISVSAFAFVLIYIAKIIFNSVELNAQTTDIKKQAVKYEFLAKQADNLAEILKFNHYNVDKAYREILEMDTLPENIRSAGTGGYIPNIYPSYTYSDKVLSAVKMKFDKLKSQIKIQSESYDKILLQANLRKNVFDSYPAIIPIDPANLSSVTSHFGRREDPFTTQLSQHPGVDLAGEFNTKVYATAQGIVELAESSFTGYGNEIIIDHGFGYKTRFGHLNKILVKRGDKIKRGQLIGLMGSTGRSTGNHLHYEVRYFGKPVNPMYFYDDNLTSAEFEELTKN